MSPPYPIKIRTPLNLKFLFDFRLNCGGVADSIGSGPTNAACAAMIMACPCLDLMKLEESLVRESSQEITHKSRYNLDQIKYFIR